MGIYKLGSSWNDFPTDGQISSIMRATKILKKDFTEQDIPPTRWEARRLQYELWNRVKAK